MATLETAMNKWARNTANAGEKWKVGVSHGDYCGAMTQFLGVRPNRMCADWQQGVGAVSAQDFQSSIAGKANKWAEGLRRAASL